MVMFQIRTHFLRNVSKRQYRGRFRNATLTHVWCCNDLNSLIWQSRGQHFWFPNCWLFPPRLYFLGYGFYTVDQLLLLHVQLNITEDINKRCPKKMSLFNRAWKSFIFRRVVIPDHGAVGMSAGDSWHACYHAWPRFTTHATLSFAYPRSVMSTCGFDYEFVAKVPREYICPICECPMRGPVQTKCGHRFCKRCLTKAMKR